MVYPNPPMEFAVVAIDAAPCRRGKVLWAMVVLLVACLMSGCGLRLSTGTVQTTDTYDLWQDRLDRMPFLVHLPDGRLEAFDDHGDAWPGSAGALDVATVRRVEVYVGSVERGAAPLCAGAVGKGAATPVTSAPINASATTAAGASDVESVLCDRTRPVVSFSDRVRPRVLMDSKAYVPHVRQLLLEGIWESVAQEPQPLHE